MKGNRLISKIIMVVIFLVGFGFILYPIVANEWNEICRRKVITVYDRQVEQSVEQGKISYENEKRKADEYNKALRFNITDDGFVSNNDNSVNNSDNDTDEDNNKDNEESNIPIEEALAYKKLLSDFNLTQEELSKRIGKSRTAITNTIRLINLDSRVQQYVIDGIISEGHGRALLSLEDGELQYIYSQKVIDEKLSVRELEKLIRNASLKSEKSEKNEELNPYYKDVRDRLQNYFGTKVNLSSKKNRGKIEIEYYSEEDLERILDIINL